MKGVPLSAVSDFDAPKAASFSYRRSEKLKILTQSSYKFVKFVINSPSPFALCASLR